MALLVFIAAKPDTIHAQTPIALELVLAIDTSTSVDDAEYSLQKQGLSLAFSHPEVVGAIEALGDLGVAVSVIQWAGTGLQKTVIDWQLLRNSVDAHRMSAALANMPREIRGMTDIGSVIRYAVSSLDENAFAGYRRVIDISGDGSSDAFSTSQERDRAIGKAVTINGLVIYNEDHDLGDLAKQDVREHYLQNVIGGDGAFLMTAGSFEEFVIAMRNKLVREITGPATALLK